ARAVPRHMIGGPAPPAPRAPAGRRREPTRPVVGPFPCLIGAEVRTAGLLAGSLWSGLFRAGGALRRLAAFVWGCGLARGSFLRRLARSRRQGRLERLHQVDDLGLRRGRLRDLDLLPFDLALDLLLDPLL